jgi:hypothetical protein
MLTDPQFRWLTFETEINKKKYLFCENLKVPKTVVNIKKDSDIKYGSSPRSFQDIL